MNITPTKPTRLLLSYIISILNRMDMRLRGTLNANIINSSLSVSVSSMPTTTVTIGTVSVPLVVRPQITSGDVAAINHVWGDRFVAKKTSV